MPPVPGHPPAAIEIAQNKLLTRERLRDTNLLVPWFFPTSVSADPSALASMVAFPCMLKPLVPTGGRSVVRANDAAAFARAFEELRAFLATPEFAPVDDEDRTTILIEDVIDGLEFAAAGVMQDGRLRVEALFDVEGAAVTPSQAPQEMRRDLVDAIARATTAIGLHQGPIHAQCMLANRGVYVLDVSLDRWRREPV